MQLYTYGDSMYCVNGVGSLSKMDFTKLAVSCLLTTVFHIGDPNVIKGFLEVPLMMSSPGDQQPCISSPFLHAATIRFLGFWQHDPDGFLAAHPEWSAFRGAVLSLGNDDGRQQILSCGCGP